MATPMRLEWLGTLNAMAAQKQPGVSNEGAAACACIWAGIPVGSMDTLGALNIGAGNGHSPASWRNLMAVCNQIAGTSNLEPLRALQWYLGQTGPP